MTKSELISYLKAAADAENGAFFCDRVCQALDHEIAALADQALPEMPESWDEDTEIYGDEEFVDALHKISDNFEENWASAFLILTMISIILVILYMVFGPGNYARRFWIGIAQYFALFLGSCILACPVALIFIYIVNPIRRGLLKEAALDRLHDKYAAKRVQTKADIITVSKSNASRANMRLILGEIKQEYSRRASKIRSMASALYKRNIINPRFCNMEAVNQILEYFKLGICNELEGPLGAYAFYMQDLRTQKICDSIQRLETNMKAGFSALARSQSYLAYQINETNRQLNGLSDSIHSDLTRIEQGISTSSKQLTSALDDIRTQTERIASDTSSLAVTEKTAAWNQYVTALANSTHRYLLRSPK